MENKTIIQMMEERRKQDAQFCANVKAALKAIRDAEKKVSRVVVQFNKGKAHGEKIPQK